MMDFNQKDLHGIVVYEIKEDGCLNGIWTNNKNKGEIRNEIAKKDNLNIGDELRHDLPGTYKVSWIDVNGDIHQGELDIKKNNNEIYSLDWKDLISKSTIYKGSGFKFGNLLVVTYW